MIYSGLKYISKTQIIKLLDYKKDFHFFENQEAIVINYKNRDYRLFHIEDVHSIIKINNLNLNPISDSIYDKFLNAAYFKENIQFKFMSSLRYCKDSHIDVMIDKQSLETRGVNNKQLKEHYESLKCFTIKNKIFFDTENLIELLLNNKLTLSTKESSLINDIKKIIMYYDLNKKLKNTKNNVNKIKI